MPKTKDGGLGSGMSPEEYRQYVQSLKDDEPQPRKRPGIEENVWIVAAVALALLTYKMKREIICLE